MRLLILTYPPIPPPQVVNEHQSSYVLKVAGSDQYFLRACPISQYKYVRACLARGEIPQMMLMSRKGVYDSLPDVDAFHIPAYYARKASLGPQAQLVSSSLPQPEPFD